MKAKSLAILIVLFLAGFALAKDSHGDGFEVSKTLLEVEVAVNTTTASISDEGAFVIQGYIYPAGTLGFDTGINEDGTAEFPDQVIGLWTCSGWLLPIRETPSGALLGPTTTQIYELDPDTTGDNMIITTGFEGVSLGATTIRAIIGGTGEYSTLRGEQNQQVVGVNLTGSPNYAMQFVKRAIIAFKK